jgi:tetratricopeptide (TPR) repeat protein
MGELDKALSDLNLAYSMNNHDYFILQRRGEVLRLMEKYKESLEMFNAAEEEFSANFYTLDRRAKLHEAMGNEEAAAQDLARIDQIKEEDR